MLIINNLCKQYPGNEHFALKSIDLDINPGEIISLVGSSGSGKTTLMKLVYGILDADSGTITFNEKPVYGPSVKLLPGEREMKFVQQDFNLNPYARVVDNIAPMLPNTDLDYKHQRIHEVLELLNILDLKDKQAVNLSGGQQQRVAIARALASSPKLLLLDEPFSNLDVMLKSHLKRDLQLLAEKTGIAILLVTHDPLDALSLSSRVVIMKDGAIIQQGTPKEVYNHPSSAYVAHLFGGVNILDAADFNAAFGYSINQNKKVVIHTHDLQLSEQTGAPAKVVKVEYNGSYEALVLEVNGSSRKLQTLNYLLGSYKAGEQCRLVVKQFTEIDN